MELFDATIRDGSYYVDFKFSSDDVTEMVHRISKLGFKYIEIGHGQGLNASSPENGVSMQSDLEYMIAANKTAGKSKIGFFCIPGIARMEDLVLASENRMDFVRIGANADDIEKTKKYVVKAKELGFEVMVNFMKTYIITPELFAEKAARIQEWGADCVYIVDSSGGMLPEELEKYIQRTKEKCDIKLGFHGHNNLGMAVYNCIKALELGVDYLDTTMQGIGRSIGNTMAEALVMSLEKKGINTGFDIPRLLEYGYYINQNIIKRPAMNPLDLICGYADFHSSNLKHIYKCCMEMHVDPLRLIIAYSKEDKKGIDREKLRSIAEKLPIDSEENPYDFRQYFSNIYN